MRRPAGFRWDACNKWLHFGRDERWVLMLGDWLAWLDPRQRQLTCRTWTLFGVSWDNGSWWAFDMDNAIVLNGRKHGFLQAYVEVTVLGVGLRRWYRRKASFDEEGFKEHIRMMGGGA